MANKNIQLKDMSGNNVFPKTKGALVLNNDGLALGGVEAGALDVPFAPCRFTAAFPHRPLSRSRGWRFSGYPKRSHW